MTKPTQPGIALVTAARSISLSTETVGSLLVGRAAELPDQPALMWLSDDGAEVMSWEQLHRRALGAASFLSSSNPNRARVAIVAYNCVEWIVAMFGCALSGMPVVPLSPTVTDLEARHLLAHGQVGVVIAGDDDIARRLRPSAESLPSHPAVHTFADITYGPSALGAWVGNTRGEVSGWWSGIGDNSVCLMISVMRGCFR